MIISTKTACKTIMIFSLSIWILSGCGKKEEKTEEQMLDKITATSIGLAYLEENQLDDAEVTFKKLINIDPDDAMGYANLGLTYLRMGKYDDAFKQLNKALEIEPNNPDIRLILAKTHEQNMEAEKAVAELEKITQATPDFAKAYYGLAEYYSKSNDESSMKKREENLKKVIEINPSNIVPRLYLMELLVQMKKTDECLARLEELRALVPEFPEESMEYYAKAKELLQKGDAEGALTNIRILHNFMKLTSLYQSGNLDIKGPGGELIGFPVITTSQGSSFVSLEGNSIMDIMRLTDVTEAVGLHIIEPGIEIQYTSLAVTDFDGDGDIDIYYTYAPVDANTSVRFLLSNELGSFTNVIESTGIDHDAVEKSATFGDFNNDGMEDLFITTTKGAILYQNKGEGKFVNISEAAGVGINVNGNDALFVDVDLEGDLDLYVINDGKNQLFRNNGDGTFTEQAEMMGLSGNGENSTFTGFGDFDDDGDLDLLTANNEGANSLVLNMRQGRFQDVSESSRINDSGKSGVADVSDYNNDGLPDVLATSSTSGKFQLYKNAGNGTFEVDAASSKAFNGLKTGSYSGAHFFDIDNDGHMDIFIMDESNGVHLFHNDSVGKFTDYSQLIPETIKGVQKVEIADFNADGDQDLFMAGKNGISLVRNETGNMNHYIKVQLVGLTNGNGKNNYFGIGAKLELKAGNLYQMQYVTSPSMHFGLGSREEADILRIVWSNGVPQNIISPKSDQDLIEEQMLKGSCPFLYTWNGEKYVFVKDMMWRSALGMPLGIMGGKTAYAFPDISKEYLKISGEMLKPKDGVYSLRITEELWETVYFDHASLIAVDHPADVDFFVDERFTLPPFAGKTLYHVPESNLPVSAKDGKGNDVMELIREKDDQYVSCFELDKYQGITEMKDLILDLGDKAKSDNLYLFLQGWIFPTDASINVAISQNNQYIPKAPSLQVLNKKGEWETVIESMGFPMGKDKTMVIDLTNKFLSADRKVKITTNMQIYWDHIFFSECAPETPVNFTTLKLKEADFQFRGYSVMYRKGGRYGPHWFDYNDVSTGQKWRDLSGYYTRYGNVDELVEKGDNKYIIANAGDEIRFEFDAINLPELPVGWKRDFLIYSEGWVKDGDLNTATGQTVEPLPFRGMDHYPYGDELQYPETEELREYHREYNTRKVDATGFRETIKSY